MFLKMHHLINLDHQAQKKNLALEVPEGYSEKEVDLMKKHYPKELAGLNKNLKRLVVEKYMR